MRYDDERLSADMPRADMEAMVSQLKIEIGVIEEDLARPRAAQSGQGPDWKVRAGKALRIKQVQIEDLQRRLETLKGFETIEHYFVESARTLLTPDTFHNLMVDARERMFHRESSGGRP